MKYDANLSNIQTHIKPLQLVGHFETRTQTLAAILYKAL